VTRTTPHAYIRDGDEIYRRSFAIIRAEADLAAFQPDVQQIVVRMIHASGMVDLAADVRCSADIVTAARTALRAGCTIFTDVNMVADGITRSRLPADNPVVCTLQAPGVAELAATLSTTRSAAAMEHWVDRLAGSVVVIGNAPTSLFRLLEMIDAGAGHPAAIIGIPVGFVGAAESKAALAEHGAGIPYVTVVGRRGGSAIAAAAVNALATERE
jgi:precorrin-8X/cobalt-precorrin-8 methylmutase